MSKEALCVGSRSKTIVQISITISLIKNLKKDAKKMSKATGDSHAKCLDVIAERKGFANWKEVMKAHSEYLRDENIPS